MVGKVTKVLLQFVAESIAEKNFKNRPTFGKVINEK